MPNYKALGDDDEPRIAAEMIPKKARSEEEQREVQAIQWRRAMARAARDRAVSLEVVAEEPAAHLWGSLALTVLVIVLLAALVAVAVLWGTCLL